VQIILLMATLVMSIVMTFGFTRMTLGELNTITAILGAILMGFGIGLRYPFPVSVQGRVFAPQRSL